MSQENEQLAQEGMHAFNERDIEGLIAAMHPAAEIELVGGFADLMGQNVFTGAREVRRFFTDWFATFKTMHVQPEGFLEAGEELVALTKLDATVEGSDIPVETLGAVVWSFRDGRTSRMALYYDRQEALDAVGLSEQK
jgi:ketosteroid isomerase-like protein